ncbi:hypothetical protein PUV47_15455 [Pseudovibrio exalbescens]|uniref:hypothetical protein n=1 Tax=Pseudovibrio exalbescens TaxID=197461 RepID=UPI0023658D65|nr:hypothetical protein [Pseudovibrio exalbescens]MDD7911326.1 hypothetical protein [Pseudovibrio exalbescens]
MTPTAEEIAAHLPQRVEALGHALPDLPPLHVVILALAELFGSLDSGRLARDLDEAHALVLRAINELEALGYLKASQQDERSARKTIALAAPLPADAG